MGDETADYELRCRAIKLRQQGVSFAQVLDKLGRGRTWLAKWWARFRRTGWAGLKTQSRAPKRQPQSMPAHVVAKVLALRLELQSHRTRASRFAGIGAEAIRLELARRRVRPLPGLRTIERIIKRHRLSGRKPARRKGGGEPYPTPRARDPGDLQQTDLVGPRHLRGGAALTRFYSFHTIALVGRAAATSQARHKSTEALCSHFLHAWGYLGLPRISQMDNEMAASGGGRYPYGFSLVMRLHLLVGVHLLFIPEGEPGRNAHIESFNDLWQERVLRHRCADLAALKRTDKAFLRYYHFDKPHRALGVKSDTTRYPGQWLELNRAELRSLPNGFNLHTYRDSRGRLRLPLARGTISFIRKVDDHGYIKVNAKPYFVGKRRAHQYVTATVYTHRKLLVIKQNRVVLKHFDFPVREPLVAPLVHR